MNAPVEHNDDLDAPVEYHLIDPLQFAILTEQDPLYYKDLIFGRFCNEQILPSVSDQNWQQFRASLKQLPTEEKLRQLRLWRGRHAAIHGSGHCSIPFKVAVQITNYINALKRGGLLK